MKEGILLLFIFGTLIPNSWEQAPTGEIVWQTGDWAMNCDFPGNDDGNAGGRGEDCSNMCRAKSGCTHYAWFNGICYYKKGPITKDRAIYVSPSEKPGLVCGITQETLTGGPKKGELVYSDDFNSIADVTNNWNQEIGGGGWGNNELQ